MIDYVNNIKNSNLTIYDIISETDTEHYIPSDTLQQILNSSLIGFSLEGLALRTRSKIVKVKICEALGYPIPKSFSKTHPRFPGQNFDVYTQKSRNVQVWNQEIVSNRRYVIIGTNDDDIIKGVKVITGDQLASYDNTGKLTHKYQATLSSRGKSVLFSENDTEKIVGWISKNTTELSNVNPTSLPNKNQLLPISKIYEKLLPIVGKTIKYLDATQERNRGAELHELICKHLGYSIYEDDGTYPDITNQLLEIKLQTSPTIDLGLHSPEDHAEITCVHGMTFNSDDIRYVIFEGDVQDDNILLKHLYVVNGNDFTEYFPLFKGKGTNSKLQLPLPNDFFD